MSFICWYWFQDSHTQSHTVTYTGT